MIQEPLNFEQPKNKLTEVADMERARLLPKNDFNKKNEYSAVNKDALADGDENGKGTGQFLDIFNDKAGAIQDIVERKKELAINEYGPSNPYKKPTT
jgi:hypothetical protein